MLDRRIVWIVPWWSPPDGLVRCVEGISAWLRQKGRRVEVWSHRAPIRPGARHVPPGSYSSNSFPALTICTLDTTAPWVRHCRAHHVRPPTAVYLHGPSSFELIRDAGFLGAVDRWFVPSHAYRWDKIEGWSDEFDVAVVQPGFDPRVYRFATNFEFRSGFVAVGGSVAKGGLTLVHVAKRIPSERLTILTTGDPPVPELKSLPNVRILEPLEDIRASLAEAALTLVPSTDETFCRTLVEAQAAECPVLASDIPTLRESGGTGAAYVDPGNVEAWAEAASILLGADEVRRSLVRRGIANAERYDPDRDFRPILEMADGGPSHSVRKRLSGPLTCCMWPGGQAAFSAGLESIGFQTVSYEEMRFHLSRGSRVLVHGWWDEFSRLAEIYPGQIATVWHSGWSGSDVMGELGSLGSVLELARKGRVTLLWLEGRDVIPEGAISLPPVWSIEHMSSLSTQPVPDPGSVVAGLHLYANGAKNTLANIVGALDAGARVHCLRGSFSPLFQSDCLVVHEPMSRRVAVDLLASADLLVHVSLSETWPYQVMEAVYSGTPAIVSDVVAWVEDLPGWARKLCVVSPATSTARISDAVRRLLNSAEDREKLVAAQRAVLDGLVGPFSEQARSVFERVGFPMDDR